MTEDTTEKAITLEDIFAELVKINMRFDGQDSRFKSYDARFNTIDNQLEVIREGIVHNGAAFDRLQAVVYNLRADVTELGEEYRKSKLALHK